MTTVYLVADGSYSDYRVLGVYSTPEKAERARDLYQADNDVEPFDLDAMPDAPPGLVGWTVQMDRDGNTRSVDRSAAPDAPYALDWSIGWVPAPDGLPRPWESKNAPVTGPCVAFPVWASDAPHAVKIANERRTRLIADGLWTTDPSEYRALYNAAYEARQGRQ